MYHCLKETALSAKMEAEVAAEFADLGDGSSDGGELLTPMVHTSMQRKYLPASMHNPRLPSACS